MLGFVCGPAIGRTKSWGVRYVDFERVERVLHRVFSDSEIADAAEGRPDRIITLKEKLLADDEAAGSQLTGSQLWKNAAHWI